MDEPKDRDSVYHSGVRIPPPLVFAGVFGGGMLLQNYLPLELPNLGNRIIAAVCMGIAAAISGWSFLAFGKARTSALPIKPTTALVISGPYRFSRNPMYLSLTFVYAGLALWFSVSWALILLPVAVFIMRVYVIAGEEAYLERKFGKDYLDYKTRVRRWI